jgi:hypothetical protein
MNSRAPKAFVGVNVADSAQHALIKKQSFDPGAARAQSNREFFFGCFERVKAETAEDPLSRVVRQNSKTSKSPDVRISQLAAIVERKKRVRVWHDRRFGRTRYDLPGHAQMNQERESRRVFVRGFEVENDKFPVAAHARDPAFGQPLLEGGRVLDEIGFAQPHVNNAPSGQHGLQSPHDRFDFRQLWHC